MLRREPGLVDLFNEMNEYEMKLISDALFCRETVGQYFEKPQKSILRKFTRETRDKR